MEKDRRYRNVRDFSGDTVVLTLKMKQKYKDKEYNLYTVCKVIKNGEKEELIPLYDETFTREQVDRFYKGTTYQTPGNKGDKEYE